MAGTHRTRSGRRLSVALVSAATATATALTVGVEPPPSPGKRVLAQNVDLAAAVQLLPTHDKVPDITGGLGTQVYDAGQAIADQLVRALVNGISFAALAQAAGVDTKSILTELLGDIPARLLPGILDTLGLQLPVVGLLLQQLDLSALTGALEQLGIPEFGDGTLTGLLTVVGLDLTDPLNLGNLNLPGVNVVTAGPTFTALKLLGLDLGWVPALPNSVANEINGSEYLKVGANGALEAVIARLNALNAGGSLGELLGTLGINLPVGDILSTLTGALSSITKVVPDLIDVRAVPTIGIGAGAFAAALAYQKVVADLANQPGGSNYQQLTGELNPLLGSLTILPMILINNPARPDGGVLARFADIGALLGIDTVNPTTHATNENGTIKLGDTGLALGGANLLPVLIDATYEYQPLSDFASWPNAVTLLNNLAAGLSPTYMLRGLSLDGLDTQLTGQILKAVGNVGAGKPLALNLYLTLQSKTLPLLEPLYLASDFLNIVGLSPLAQIPMRLANALAPALKILTNIGYTNVDPDKGYDRDFSQAGTEVPFLSFPNIDIGRTIGDTLTALIGGFQKELGPNPTPNTPNVLANLLNALLGGDLLGGLNLGGLATPLVASTATSEMSKTAAGDIPSPNAKLLRIASVGESSFDADQSKDSVQQDDSALSDGPAAGGTTTPPVDQTPPPVEKTPPPPVDKTPPPVGGDKTPAPPVGGDTTPGPPVNGDTTPATGDQTTPGANDDGLKPPKGPRHVKDDGDAEPGNGDATGGAGNRQPRHARPVTNDVRDTAHDFSLRPGKLADKPGATGATGIKGSDTTPGTDATDAAPSPDKAA